MRGKLTLTTLLLIQMLIFSGIVGAAESVRVVNDLDGIEASLGVTQEGVQATTLGLTIPAVAINDVSINGETYKQVDLPSTDLLTAGESGEQGMPSVPILTSLVAIPDYGGVSLEVSYSGFDVIENIDLLPVQPFALESGENSDLPFTKDEAQYQTDAFYPGNLAEAGEPAIMRDLRLVQVALYPVQYNPVKRELHVYHDLSVRVNYTQDDAPNPLTTRRPYLSEAFYPLYKATVSNFDEIATTSEVKRGGYLIITQASFVDTLKALAAWKHKKGYDVQIVRTTDIYSSGNPSSAQIFTYLQNAYRNWETPPEYVMLVGDEDNTTVSGVTDYPYESYASDHHYSTVDGSDYLSDMFVSRLSIDNMTDLRKALAKVMAYETAPYMEDIGYWQRGLSVAGNVSATTPRITVLWVRQLLLQYGFVRVDTSFRWSSGESDPRLPSLFNQGVSIVSYRGWAGATGWYSPSFNVSALNALSNNNMIGVMASLVCGTGNFGSSTDPCFGETWIRMGASPTSYKGGPAFYGVTDGSTHTRWNNPIMVGYYWGIFKENNYHFASAAVRGKIQQYNTFPRNRGVGDYVEQYFHTYNMLGDPELEVRTKIPIQILVNHPATLPLGVNHIEITVSSNTEQPIENAFVTLIKGYGANEEVFEVGRTDAAGIVSLSFDANTADTMFLTVSGRDLYPYQGHVIIEQSGIAVGFDSLSVDDDAQGYSRGNADGILNPGETVELSIVLKNFGNLTEAQNVQATLEAIDVEMVSVHEANRSYDNIAPGAVASTDPFVIGFLRSAQDGDIARLKLSVTDQSGDFWYSVIELPVVAPKYQVTAITVQDGNNRLDPGDSVGIVLSLKNIGHERAQDVQAILSTMDDYSHVYSSQGSFGTIGMDSIGQNLSSPMWLKISPQAFDGRQINLSLQVTTGYGPTTTVQFSTTVGTIATSDPIGPDAYGYYMYDDTDLGYSPVPTYSWVELVPSLGGHGTRLNYVGSTDDNSVLITLPFTFDYYGEQFDHMIVCTNGFAALDTSRYDMYGNFWNLFFNWPIPDPGNASGQISPFWDDLQFSGTSYGVYTWHDTTEHRFVIEWYHMTHRNTSSVETFEMIILDPEYYPTVTGDAEILYQYQAIVNNDTQEAYASVGFESFDELRGLSYTYDNANTPGAAALAPNRAIKITTNTGRGAIRPDVMYGEGGLASGVLIIASTGQWRLTDVNGSCWITDIPPGVVAFTASKDGYFPSRFDSLEISANRTLEGTDFVLSRCPIPDSLSATDSLGNRVEIAWQAVTHPDLVGYDLYRSLWENGEYVKVNTTPISGIAYTDITPDSAAYWYYVRALYTTTLGEAISFASNKDRGGYLNQTGIEEGQIPATFSLSQNYPNPFNPTTSISFGLPKASPVRLEVFNLLGQRVRTLVSGTLEAGYRTVSWDGRDESGEAVSSGIYLYKLSADGFQKSHKMLLLK